MINVAEITAALQTQLQDHVLLRDFKVSVQRGEYLNVDASLTPWVGIYKGNVEFDPRTLGRGAQNWSAQVHLDIVVQAHGDGGAAAEDKLGDAVQRVISAMLEDLTFRGTVEMVKKYTVEFTYQRTDTSTLDFQTAIISVQAELRAGA